MMYSVLHFLYWDFKGFFKDSFDYTYFFGFYTLMLESTLHRDKTLLYCSKSKGEILRNCLRQKEEEG